MKLLRAATLASCATGNGGGSVAAIRCLKPPVFVATTKNMGVVEL